MLDRILYVVDRSESVGLCMFFFFTLKELVLILPYIFFFNFNVTSVYKIRDFHCDRFSCYGVSGCSTVRNGMIVNISCIYRKNVVPTYKTRRCHNEFIPAAVWTTLLLIKDKH